MDGHKIDAARLAEQGDRAYGIGEVENDLEHPAELLPALWWMYRQSAATIMGATLVRSGDSLRFAR